MSNNNTKKKLSEPLWFFLISIFIIILMLGIFYSLKVFPIADIFDNKATHISDVLTVVVGAGMAFAGAWVAIRISENTAKVSENQSRFEDIKFLDEKVSKSVNDIKVMSKYISSCYKQSSSSSKNKDKDKDISAIRLRELVYSIRDNGFTYMIWSKSNKNNESYLNQINIHLAKKNKNDKSFHEKLFLCDLEDPIENISNYVGSEQLKDKTPIDETSPLPKAVKDFLDLGKKLFNPTYITQLNNNRENNTFYYEINYGAAILADLIQDRPKKENFYDIVGEIVISLEYEKLHYFLNYDEKRYATQELIEVLEYIEKNINIFIKGYLIPENEPVPKQISTPRSPKLVNSRW